MPKPNGISVAKKIRTSCQTSSPPQDCQTATPISASGTTVTARLAKRSIGLPAAGMPAVYSASSAMERSFPYLA